MRSTTCWLVKPSGIVRACSTCLPDTSVSMTSCRLALCLNKYSPAFTLPELRSTASTPFMSNALSMTPFSSSVCSTSSPFGMLTVLSAGRGPGAPILFDRNDQPITITTAATMMKDRRPLTIEVREARLCRGGADGGGGGAASGCKASLGLFKTNTLRIEAGRPRRPPASVFYLNKGKEQRQGHGGRRSPQHFARLDAAATRRPCRLRRPGGETPAKHWCRRSRTSSTMRRRSSCAWPCGARGQSGSRPKGGRG